MSFVKYVHHAFLSETRRRVELQCVVLRLAIRVEVKVPHQSQGNEEFLHTQAIYMSCVVW